MTMGSKENRVISKSSNANKGLNKNEIDRLVAAHSHVRAVQPYSDKKIGVERNELEKRKRCGKVHSFGSARH